MASASPDQTQTPNDLWRDFPRTSTEFEARFACEEDLSRLLVQGALGRHAGVREVWLDAGVVDTRRPAV